MKSKALSYRYFLLCIGTFTMLFAGIIYAWSIIKSPFATELGFDASSLALNYTLTMCFFCLGGFLSSQLLKKLSINITVALSGTLAGLGFILTSFVEEGNVFLLYFTYALMAGLGIGMAYIVMVSTVNSWFPDRKGFSSGALMMGFGASSLVLGNLADMLFKSEIGWQKTYIILGVSLGVVILISSIFMKKPDPEVDFPAPKVNKNTRSEDFEAKDYRPTEMLRRFTFWRAFIGLVCLTAVGSSVISFAKDLALSVGAEATLATTLVGVLAVCNGLGRIIIGAVFDSMGRRFTMIISAVLTIVAAGVTLVAVSMSSLPLCIIGLCLTGISYGSSPTVSSAFSMAFYGKEHFATNLSLMNFNLIGASFMATLSANLLTSTGGYTAPFIMLLILSIAALLLNISIKKP